VRTTSLKVWKKEKGDYPQEYLGGALIGRNSSTETKEDEREKTKRNIITSFHVFSITKKEGGIRLVARQ